MEEARSVKERVDSMHIDDRSSKLAEVKFQLRYDIMFSAGFDAKIESFL